MKRLLLFLLLSVPAWAALNLTTADSQYVNATAVLNNVNTDQVGSVTAWVNVCHTAAASRIITFGDTDAATYVNLYISTDPKFFAVAANAAGGGVRWTLETNAAISLGVHLFGISHNGTQATLYVDGVAVAQTFTGSTDKTVWIGDLAAIDSVQIGTQNFNSLGYRNFLNDITWDVRVYSVALTAKQHRDLFCAQGSDKMYMKADSCKMRLPLDQYGDGTSSTAGMSLYDLSAYANHGLPGSAKATKVYPIFRGAPVKKHGARQ